MEQRAKALDGINSTPLISLQEVEKLEEHVVNTPQSLTKTILLVISVVLFVLAGTLLVMILFSVKGATTGLSTVLPFLDQPAARELRLP